jgi:hypothetical protein
MRVGLPGVEKSGDGLGLTGDQKRSFDSIFGEYRRVEREARERAGGKLKAVLSERQWAQWNTAMSASADATAAEKQKSDAGKGTSQVPVTFSGGFEADRRDGGRPVGLIAAALGVSTDVFRQAFSGVTPAAGGRQPEAGQVRRNKNALLRVLGPYGITNDRLDEVSNYYRYRPGQGELWRHRPAAAVATIRDGMVTGFTITDPGAGYSSVPVISVHGTPSAALDVKIKFGTDLESNGSIDAITIQRP